MGPVRSQELEEDVGAMLMTLSLFSSRTVAEAFCTETKHANLAKLATTMRTVLPQAMAEYAAFGRSIEEAIREADATDSNPQTARVDRNDPCPCGSGRKYKKCCGGS